MQNSATIIEMRDIPNRLIRGVSPIKTGDKLFFDGGSSSGMVIMMFFMMFFWLIFLVLLVVGLIYLAKGISPQTTGTQKEDSFEILKARYAKGEITKEQYEQMKKDLGF